MALLTGQRHTPTGQAAFQVTGPSASLDEFQASAQGDGITIPASSLGSAYLVPLMPSQKHADVLAKLRRGIQFDALQNSETQKVAQSGVQGQGGSGRPCGGSDHRPAGQPI